MHSFREQVLHSAISPTCDDDVKVLQPVGVAIAAGLPGQQKVHDHVRVVPQAVGRQEQAPARSSEALEQLQQARILHANRAPG